MGNNIGFEHNPYEEIFMSLQDAVFLADPKTGIIVNCNKSAEKLLKRTKEEIVGQHQEIIHPPEKLDYYRQVFEEHSKGNGGFAMEVEVATSTSEIRWASIRASRIHFKDKDILAGVFRDITEQKIAENILHKNEERLALATRGTGIGIWDYDFREDKLVWDEQTFELYGINPYDFCGTLAGWTKFILPEALPVVLADFNKAVSGDSTLNIEFPVVRPDGSICYIAVAGTFLRDKTGDILRAVGVSYDITTRVKSQEELKQAKEQWEKTFNTVPDLISILDKDFKIIRVNKAMADRLNKDPESCSGIYCYIDAHDADQPPEKCPFEETLVDGKTHTAEIDEPHLGGVFQVTTSPLIDENGNVEGCVHVARDITEWKKMQKTLVDNERMAAVGVLVAGVAHEFNNALTGVTGYMQMISDHKDLPAEVPSFIDKAFYGIRRIGALTQSLMAFTDDAVERKTVFSLDSMVRQVVLLASSEMQFEHIKLSVEVEAFPFINGDSDEIGQVVLHLITNAVHSLIGRENKEIFVNVSIENEMACVKVTDTGIGIAPEDLSDIFLPFFSRKGEKALPDSPMQKAKGTGLGLSICRHMIEKHDGSLTVESELGKGSCFKVLLPVADCSNEEKIDAQGEGNSLSEDMANNCAKQSGVNVMIVDDDKDVLEYLMLLLEPLDINVVGFGNSEDALAALENTRFDLAYIDLIMPGIDGEGIIRRIKKLPVENQPEIAVVTGWSKKDKLKEISNLGVQHIIAKPFDSYKIIDIAERFSRSGDMG